MKSKEVVKAVKRGHWVTIISTTIYIGFLVLFMVLQFGSSFDLVELIGSFFKSVSIVRW